VSVELSTKLEILHSGSEVVNWSFRGDDEGESQWD